MSRRNAFGVLRFVVWGAALGLTTGTSSAARAEGLATSCDLSGRKTLAMTFDPPLAIPNASGGAPGHMTTAAITVPHDGDIIEDVVVGLRASHTWVGDLILTVAYDPDCDGPGTAVTATVLCRPRGMGATTPAPCGTGIGFGCSGDFACANTYLFDDTASDFLGEGSCAPAVAGGCFKPTATGGSPLAGFENMPKGGCFSLEVTDYGAGDAGTLCEWSVHIRNSASIGVEPTSWGRAKLLYD